MKCTFRDLHTGEEITSDEPIQGKPANWDGWGSKEIPDLPPPGDEPAEIGFSVAK